MPRAILANRVEFPVMGEVMVETALAAAQRSAWQAARVGNVVSWVLSRAGIQKVETGLSIDRNACELTSEEMAALMRLSLEDSGTEIARAVEELLRASRDPGDEGEIAQAALDRAMEKWGNCLDGIMGEDPEIRAHNAAVVLAQMMGISNFACGPDDGRTFKVRCSSDVDAGKVWRNEDGVSLAERQTRVGRRRWSFSQACSR